MDRLEQHLDSLMASWDSTSCDAVCVAGLLVALLLFADDIALAARSLDVLQRLMDALSDFCEAAALSVNESKTHWLTGGYFPRKHGCEVLLYRGREVSEKASFKYLGLVFTGSPHLTDMAAARLTAARAAWGKLMGLLVAHGW